jgi:hypothetical protein
MTIAEQIYAIVEILPHEQASEILTFAKSIRAKHLGSSQFIHEVDSETSQFISFKTSLRRLHDLTQDLPTVDPVALIRSGREELDERGCV